jgi:hypothetical protein
MAIIKARRSCCLYIGCSFADETGTKMRSILQNVTDRHRLNVSFAHRPSIRRDYRPQNHFALSANAGRPNAIINSGLIDVLGHMTVRQFA